MDNELSSMGQGSGASAKGEAVEGFHRSFRYSP